MIFLSASVPTPEREFFGTENIFAIREAIIAFTTVCVQYGIRFYFGGHPAITPLVWDVAMQNIKQGMPLIDIYQSKVFGENIPKEVQDFNNVHFTEAVNGSIQESVMAMRKQMFTENQTECAIFIGGTNGILDEYNMLHSMYPKAKCYAFASTGGASIELYKIVIGLLSIKVLPCSMVSFSALTSKSVVIDTLCSTPLLLFVLSLMKDNNI